MEAAEIIPCVPEDALFRNKNCPLQSEHRFGRLFCLFCSTISGDVSRLLLSGFGQSKFRVVQEAFAQKHWIFDPNLRRSRFLITNHLKCTFSFVTMCNYYQEYLYNCVLVHIVRGDPFSVYLADCIWFNQWRDDGTVLIQIICTVAEFTNYVSLNADTLPTYYYKMQIFFYCLHLFIYVWLHLFIYLSIKPVIQYGRVFTSDYPTLKMLTSFQYVCLSVRYTDSLYVT